MTVTLSPSPKTSQASQTVINKVLNRLTSMTDLKFSADQIKSDMTNFTTKFQVLKMCLDGTEVKLEELDYQTSFDHKDVIKHELHASAKILKFKMCHKIKMKLFTHP